VKHGKKKKRKKRENERKKVNVFIKCKKRNVLEQRRGEKKKKIKTKGRKG